MELTIRFKIKQIFGHAFVYGLTASLQNVLGFVLLPILTAYYSTTLFGIYSIILLVSALASATFYLGASSALGRFYYEEEDPHYKKQVITTALLITVFGAVLLITITLFSAASFSQWLFGTREYAHHLIIALTAAALGFLLNVLTLILRYEKKSFLFLIITVTGVIINFLITYVLLTKYHLGILAPIYGLLFSNLFNFLVLITNVSKFFTRSLSKQHVRMLFVFGVLSSANGLLFYLLDWIDRLIIKELLNLSDVGIYSLGYRIAALINVFLVMPFTLIWGPMRMEYAKNKNANEFTTKIVSYYSIVGFLIILFAVLFGRDLMQLLFKNPDYSGASKVFPVIMLAQLFFGYQNILDYGIYLSKKIHYYLLVAFISIIINIGLNYLLIPHYGYMAAAYTTLLTYFISSVLIYLISIKYYKLDLELKRILIPLGVLMACMFFSNAGFITRIALAFVSIICFLTFWFNTNEKAFLSNKIPALFRNK